MRSILSNILASASLAIAGGVYMGYSTVAGASANYGASQSYTDDVGTEGETAAFDCVGCTDDELGFEWAAARQIPSEVGCNEGSWAFRRGCMDFTESRNQPG
jgi:hypothetical protein